MSEPLDEIMERASQSLVRMDYLTTESLCLEALAEARRRGDFAYYARVLLPLQEARRQRRMIAAEGLVCLGSSGWNDPMRAQLESMSAGCVVLTRPATAGDAARIAEVARRERRFVEVLFADGPASLPKWTLRSFRGPSVSCEVAAPPGGWIDRWLQPGEAEASPSGKTPADWFIDATEALGDAAIAQVVGDKRGADRLEALESCLEAITDHEIIHQRLADAARSLSATGRKS